MRISAWLAVGMMAISCYADTPGTGPAVLSPELLKNLASDDFATRQAAQEGVNRVPASQRAELVKLIGQTADPEVRARLQEGLDEIDYGLLVHPAPISVKLDRASLDEAAQAFSRAIGIPINKSPAVPADSMAGTITLAVKDGSFFEALRQVDAIVPFGYGATAYGLSMTRMNDFAIANTRFGPLIVSGPLMFQTISGRRTGELAQYSMFAYVDPRIPTVARSYAATSAVDANGKPVAIAKSGPAGMGIRGPTGPGQYAPINYNTWSLALQAPADAKSPITVKGDARLLLVVKSETKVLDEPEKHVNEVMMIGGRSVKMQQFVFAEGAVTGRVRMSVMNDPAATSGNLEAGSGSAALAPIEYSVFDSTGKCFATVAPGPEGVVMIPTQSAKGPMKMVFTAPLQWKAIMVPFELKGLALPEAK